MNLMIESIYSGEKIACQISGQYQNFIHKDKSIIGSKVYDFRTVISNGLSNFVINVFIWQKNREAKYTDGETIVFMIGKWRKIKRKT